jgi:hypothetical protein
MRLDAMRHYSAAPASVIRHQPWVDGVVLFSTLCFGLLLAFFMLEVLPAGGSPLTMLSSIRQMQNPMLRLLPPPPLLPPQPVGVAQSNRGIVTQVAEPRWSSVEGGRDAGPGLQFLVLTAIVDNQSTQAIVHDLSDWIVVDGAGIVHDPERFRSAGWLSTGRIDPGQRVQGTLAFVVPKGDPGQQIRFSPPAMRAVLRWDAVAPAAS